LSPPFKKSFSNQNNKEMIDSINSFNLGILFVGRTCPKEKNRIDAKLVCNVVGVFNWTGDTQKDIHSLWWKLRLTWLKRIIDRPKFSYVTPI
jgi:N-acetylglucosaminyldiphosphoundecaprenol N-acetyl-beta-D-mannosaminyltransferase